MAYERTEKQMEEREKDEFVGKESGEAVMRGELRKDYVKEEREGEKHSVCSLLSRLRKS